MLEVIASKTEFPSISQDLESALSRFGGLKIAGIDDKAGAKSVKEAIQDVKKIRIAWEKKLDGAFAEVRERIKALQKDSAAEIQKFKDLESNLRNELKRIEEEIESIKLAEQMAAELRFTQRTDQLFSIGFTYNGRVYGIGAYAYTPEDIDKMPDDEFDQLKILAQQEQERIEDIKRAIAEAEEQARIKRAIEAAEAQKEQFVEKSFAVESEPEQLEVSEQEVETASVEDPVFDDMFSGPIKEGVALPFAPELPAKNNGLTSEYKMGFDACKSLALQIMLNAGDLGEAINAVADLEYS